MYQLNKIVFPKITAYCEDVAYSSLHYDIPMVEGIKAVHSNDTKKCCRELFMNQLTSENGVSPKTWGNC